jgi:hypothetical protein
MYFGRKGEIGVSVKFSSDIVTQIQFGAMVYGNAFCCLGKNQGYLSLTKSQEAMPAYPWYIMQNSNPIFDV